MKKLVWALSALVCLSYAPGFGQSTFGTILGTVKTIGECHSRRGRHGHERGHWDRAYGHIEWRRPIPVSEHATGNVRDRRREVGFRHRKDGSGHIGRAAGTTPRSRHGIGCRPAKVWWSGGGRAVNTENANISNTINNNVVTNLPANYRGASSSPLAAIVALPNVQQDQNGTCISSR